MEFGDVVAARYSVRGYQETPVPEEALLRVLEAARLAPSACNIQPWHFYVVRDAATRRALFPVGRHDWAAAAPVVIVACSIPSAAWVRRYDNKNHADIDVAIAMEHLMLAATAEGLGTCWMCAFDPALVRTALELPAELEPVAITPLGYPATTHPETVRKALEAIVTWR